MKILTEAEIGGPEYFQVLPGEILKVGDEIQLSWSGRWIALCSSCAGEPRTEESSLPCRRRLPFKMADGYHLVRVGETIESGDQYCNEDNNPEEESSWSFYPTGNGRIENGRHGWARRKIKTPPPPSPPVTKPPLGILSRRLHIERRQHSLLAAMERYVAAGMPIPTDWSVEYIELLFDLRKCQPPLATKSPTESNPFGCDCAEDYEPD